MPIRKVVLIQPRRDGRFWGRGTSQPYTLMRLASLVPAAIPVEIWDEDLGELPIHSLGRGDLVGISAKTPLIDRAKMLTKCIQKQGTTVVLGGTHTTLVPDEVEAWADIAVVAEAHPKRPQLIRDFEQGSLQTRYADEEWTPLDSGVALARDWVLEQVKEYINYCTPYLEIARGCPRNCPAGKG